MENLLEITIDYDKNEDKPERIFKTIALLLENLEDIDNILCETIPVKIATKTYLENVESGSLKLFLRNEIAKIDDEALAQGDFLKVLGLYLKDAKYSFLGYLDKNIQKDNKKKSLQELQKDIFDKSRKYELDKLKTYKTIPKQKLAKSIASLNTTFGSLTAKESITIKQDNQALQLSYNPNLSLQTFEEEITEKTFTIQTPMILKIRKPDYLGESQWEFRSNGKTIKAHISDADWLQNFQNAKIIAKPQDSLDCIVNIETKYDNNNELIDDIHDVIKVNKVIAQDSSIQTNLDI